MSASDEFPRGWTLAGTGGSGGISLTVPALVGVAHVISSVSASVALFSNSSAVAAITRAAIVSSSSGNISSLALMLLYLPPTSVAGDMTKDAGEWTGVISSLPGDSITVNIAALTGFCALSISGYDV